MKGLPILLDGMQLSNLFSFILNTLLEMATFSYFSTLVQAELTKLNKMAVPTLV